MNAAQLLSLATEAARGAGYEVREEVLDGAGGGHCLIHRRKCLLLDVTQDYREQLSDVLDALRAEADLDPARLHPLLQAHLREPLERVA